MKGTCYKHKLETIPFYLNSIFLLLPFNFTWVSEACVTFRHTRVHPSKTSLIVLKRDNDTQVIIGILKILLYIINKTLTIHHLRNTEKGRQRKQKIQP